MKTRIILSALLIGFASCVDSIDQSSSIKPDIIDNDELIMATLYNYYAAEYKAISYQAFNFATERISRIADLHPDRSSLAIIVDIDETILDNSPYQAKLINEKAVYPEHWNEWCNLSKARPVPGAIRFLKYADSLGFAIFYISNRKKDFVEEGTIKNLQKSGFPQVEKGKILLRESLSGTNPEPSNKESRRNFIKDQGFKIVLLAGDNLGDFFEDFETADDRDRIVDSLKNEFGSKFILLPNAMYGNWPASIGIDGDNRSIDKLIKNMTTLFEEK